jgi:putative ABC transport system permease protein
MLHLILVDLRRHAARTVLTASGIAVGVATIVALLSLSAGIERSAAGLVNLGGAELGLFQGGVGELTASALPVSLVARVARRPGVDEAAPIAVAPGELPSRRSFLVFGVEPDSFVFRQLVFLAGHPPARRDEAVVGDGAARQLDLRVGGRLALVAGDFRIVGIYHSGVPFEDQGAALPLAAVQRLLGRATDATTIAVKLSSGARAADVGADLERAFRGTVAISQPGQVSRVDTNSLLVRKAARVFAALALVIGGIAVLNTMLMAVFERRSEFGLLLALGWPRRLVAGLVLREALLLSVAGAALGLGIGVAAGDLIVRLLAASALVSPHVTAWALVEGVVVALATGAIGSLYPAWWVTRLHPVEAMG